MTEKISAYSRPLDSLLAGALFSRLRITYMSVRSAFPRVLNDSSCTDLCRELNSRLKQEADLGDLKFYFSSLVSHHSWTIDYPSTFDRVLAFIAYKLKLPAESTTPRWYHLFFPYKIKASGYSEIHDPVVDLIRFNPDGYSASILYPAYPFRSLDIEVRVSSKSSSVTAHLRDSILVE
jgi:hypothetical protein